MTMETKIMRDTMKEKRAPSRSLSLWFYLGLGITVFLSCGLISWFSLINPFVMTMPLDDNFIYWDSSTQTLNFFGDPIGRSYPHIPAGYYSLDRQGHLICLWRRNTDHRMPEDQYEVEAPIHSLTPEQLAALEERYGAIRGYDVVTPDMTVLVTDSNFLLGVLNRTQLVVLNNATHDSDIVIGALTFYWTNIACEHQQPFLILNSVALIAAVITLVKVTRRMRYKNMWLLGCMVLIALGLLLTHLMAYIDD
jgi:hypothetical protein